MKMELGEYGMTYLLRLVACLFLTVSLNSFGALVFSTPVSSTSPIKKYDASTGELLGSFGSADRYSDLAYGNGFIFSTPVGGGGGGIKKYDASTGELLGSFGSADRYSDLAYGNGFIFSTPVSSTSPIKKYDASTGELLGSFGSVDRYSNIAASHVPLPAGIYLFLSGLVGIVGVKLRGRNA